MTFSAEPMCDVRDVVTGEVRRLYPRTVALTIRRHAATGGDTVSREEKIQQARAMRADGATLREIGDHFGVAGSTVLRWTDEGCRQRELAASRAYKAGSRGECVDCGGPTNACRGPGKASQRCDSCRREFQRANAKWTKDTVVVAIQRFAAEHGRPPTATEWRRLGDYTPPTNAVLRVWGSWANAVEAAGFPRPRSGVYDCSRSQRAAA